MKKLMLAVILMGSAASAYAVSCCYTGAACCPGPCCPAKSK